MEKIFLILFMIFLCVAASYGGISALDIASISRAKADEIRQESINRAIEAQNQQQMKLLEMQAQAAERQAKIIADAQEDALKQQAQSVWLSTVPIFAVAAAICSVMMMGVIFALVVSRIKQKANPPNRMMVYWPSPPQMYFPQHPQLQDSRYYYPEVYQGQPEYEYDECSN